MEINSIIESVLGIDSQGVIFKSGSDAPSAAHPPTLNAIQIRAYRIHQEHGAVYGGYSLDEWLQAEHELEDELKKSPKSGQTQ